MHLKTANGQVLHIESSLLWDLIHRTVCFNYCRCRIQIPEQYKFESEETSLKTHEYFSPYISNIYTHTLSWTGQKVRNRPSTKLHNAERELFIVVIKETPKVRFLDYKILILQILWEIQVFLFLYIEKAFIFAKIDIFPQIWLYAMFIDRRGRSI